MRKSEKPKVRWKMSSGIRSNEDNESKVIQDEIPLIKGCATMWHETSDEMIEMIKSIFR